jgi:hypothetical protein
MSVNFENYSYKFHLHGKPVFAPSKLGCQIGKDIKERVERSYVFDDFYYHFRKGGHVAALHSHRPNRYFCKLDIENFFYSIGRNRVARCLRSISVKRSAQYAKWSCVKNPFQKPSYALPYGFVQSTSLATLALSQSALGSALRKAASHCNVAVYVDDITLSSNSITTLNDIFEELVPAFNEADLQENKQKRIQPCEKMSVFNCSLTQNSTHVELDRIAEFHQCNQAPASVEGFERYCRSVMKGNQ